MSSHKTQLKPLKFLLNFIFIIVIIVVGINIIGVIFTPFFPESEFLSGFSSVPYNEWKLSILLLMIISIILNIGFVYSVYVFKKLVRSFYESPLFSKFQILSLKLLGQLIILLVITKSVFDKFSNLILENKKSDEIYVFSFDSTFMAICLGLFLIYLSYVFKQAKDLKDENELTV